MARRYGKPFYGSKYIGVPEIHVVHDLDFESQKCKIDESLEKYEGLPFSPDTIDQAYIEGYDKCGWCLGGGGHY